MQTAVLIDERDRQIGTARVNEACWIIQHDDRLFVRTMKGLRLHHANRGLAVIFEETEPYVRNHLERI